MRDARHTDVGDVAQRPSRRPHWLPAATAGLRHRLGFRDVFAESATRGRSTDGEVVIETRELVKRFGEREALKGVSFDAHRGELLAVIGPNGAGKTTLLSILAGIRRQDGGTVSRPPGEIGWIPQQAALYRRLTVIENLRLFARLEKVPDTDARGRGDARPDRRSRDRRDDQVGTLSGGNQQRINIAIGLLAAPRGPAARRAERRARPAPARAPVGVRARSRRRRHDGDLLHSQHRRGRALRPAPAGAGRRRGAVRRHLDASCTRRFPSRARATSSRRSSPSCGTAAIEPSWAEPGTDALAVPQGPPDPAPLAAGDGAARRLSGGDRRADRLRALARAREAPGRLPQRGPPGPAVRPRRHQVRHRGRSQRALLADRLHPGVQRAAGARHGRVGRRARGADPAAGPDPQSSSRSGR